MIHTLYRILGMAGGIRAISRGHYGRYLIHASAHRALAHTLRRLL